MQTINLCKANFAEFFEILLSENKKEVILKLEQQEGFELLHPLTKAELNELIDTFISMYQEMEE